MNFEAKITLSPVQISEIVSDYIKNKTGNKPVQVTFNAEPRSRGYGYGEYTETVFTGAIVTIDVPLEPKTENRIKSLKKIKKSEHREDPRDMLISATEMDCR